MKTRFLSQWIIRMLLILAVAGNTLSVSTQSVSAKPLSAPYTNNMGQSSSVIGLTSNAGAFALDPTGSISGTVVDDGNNPIEGAQVCAENDDPDVPGGCVQSDSNGDYTINSLADGGYRVEVWADGWAHEYYKDGYSYQTGRTVYVIAGLPTSNIDFSLEPGGNIRGVVYQSNGSTPIPNMNISVDGPGFESGGCTNQDGIYNVGYIAYGIELRVQAAPSGKNWCGGSIGYMSEYWSDAISWADAATLTLDADNSSYDNINFVLESGYTISGNARPRGVTFSYVDGIPKTATSTGGGNYSFTVSPGWSGTITPSKAGYVFTPQSLTYEDVSGHLSGQNYSNIHPTFWVWPKYGAGVETIDWPLGDEITLTIDNPGTPQNPDHGPYIATVENASWPGSTKTYAGFDFPFDIPAGHVINITNGIITITHTVTEIEVTNVNPDTNIVTGSAAPNSLIEVNVEDSDFYETATDENGDWAMDFSNIYDIAPESWIQAAQSDDDFDMTFSGLAGRCHTLTTNINGGGSVDAPRASCAGKYVHGREVELTATPALGFVFTGWYGDASGMANPLNITMDADKTIIASFDRPHIIAHTNKNNVDVYGWPSGTPLSMTIDGSGPYYATAGPVDFEPYSPVASFKLNPSGFDLQAGQLITVTDSGSPARVITYVPTNVTITRIDGDTNIVTGTAVPGTDVRVCVNLSGSCVERNVTAAAGTGIWTANYNGSVVLKPGSTRVFATQSDSNGNKTQFGWINPYFWVWPKYGAGVETLEWPFGNELTLTIDDPGTTKYPDYGPYRQTVGNTPWPGSTGTYAGFDFPFDIPPGHIIKITDGMMTRTHIVTGIEVKNVNTDTNVVTGVASPNSAVEVNEVDNTDFYETTTDEDGNWSMDFTSIYDIVPESWIQAYEEDDDGDMTFSGLAGLCHTLTTSVNPTGGGSVDLPRASCAGKYAHGQEVELTAIPAAGYVFSSWGGDPDCADGSVNMNSDMSCTANFALQQIERAKNGGFNIYSGTSKIPTNWARTNFASTDGKDTGIKKEGAASVRIIGAAGTTKTLTQTLSLSGTAGQPFSFSYWVKAYKMPSTGLCRGQVLFYYGSTLKGTKTLNCPTGATYSWKQATLNSAAPAAYNKVVIKFTFSKASGRAWFDLASLLR